jgi:hypothetical protein
MWSTTDAPARGVVVAASWRRRLPGRQPDVAAGTTSRMRVREVRRGAPLALHPRMKNTAKNTKKLELDTLTLRDLTAAEIRTVVGGMLPYTRVTQCGSGCK